MLSSYHAPQHAAEQRRRPDSGSLGGEPPLHDRVQLRQRHARVAEQAAQDRGARGEGQVRDDRERLVRQRQHRRVAFDHVDARIAVEARFELPQCSLVELDRAHAGARVGKRAGQCAVARTEVEHERPGREPRVADQLVCESATTKSVATARPRLR